MAKKVVKEEVIVEQELSHVCIVSDQAGNEVKRFSDVNEALSFASTNGYQVTITN